MQAILKGTVTVTPIGHDFDPFARAVTASSPVADFSLNVSPEDHAVLEEQETTVEDADIDVSSKKYPDAPELRIDRGTLPQGTKIKCEIVENIPTFEEDGLFEISGHGIWRAPNDMRNVARVLSENGATVYAMGYPLMYRIELTSEAVVRKHTEQVWKRNVLNYLRI